MDKMWVMPLVGQVFTSSKGKFEVVKYKYDSEENLTHIVIQPKNVSSSQKAVEIDSFKKVEHMLTYIGEETPFIKTKTSSADVLAAIKEMTGATSSAWDNVKTVTHRKKGSYFY